MPFLEALANTFQVTVFDAGLIVVTLLAVLLMYYFLSLHQVFEAAFGAIVGLGIYILLSVVLLGNPTLSTEGGLFPLGFSVFLVSLALYLVWVLMVLFPLHGGLVISEPTHPTLYTLIFLGVSSFLVFAMGAVAIYMIEQSYVFHVGNILTWIRDTFFYQENIRKSAYYGYVMSHQNMIIPLGIVLMLYKLLLSNLINAAFLSIWYNLANVGFYRKKEDASYRVEFHEVGGSGHGDEHAHDDHGGHDAHDDHGHGTGHGGHH